MQNLLIACALGPIIGLTVRGSTFQSFKPNSTISMIVHRKTTKYVNHGRLVIPLCREASKSDQLKYGIPLVRRHAASSLHSKSIRTSDKCAYMPKMPQRFGLSPYFSRRFNCASRKSKTRRSNSGGNSLVSFSCPNVLTNSVIEYLGCGCDCGCCECDCDCCRGCDCDDG